MKDKGGIQLDLNDEGDVYVVEDTDSFDFCVANMRCEHAKRIETKTSIAIVCHVKKNNPINVFTINRCPVKKWGIYKDVRKLL